LKDQRRGKTIHELGNSYGPDPSSKRAKTLAGGSIDSSNDLPNKNTHRLNPRTGNRGGQRVGGRIKEIKVSSKVLERG